MAREKQLNVEKATKQIAENKQSIKYDTRDYVIEYLVNKFHDDEFFIPSEYQRKFIWNDTNKCNFIESILIGLPIPFMFFADTDDGRTEIVDGAQRTSTLVQFMDNELELKGLEILTDVNGFYFSDLDISTQRRFKNTIIRVVFLEEGTTERIRQEIFKRINTSGEKANPAEVRRGSMEGKFKSFLEQSAKDELFMKLAPRTKKTEDRFEGFELVSRYFTYLDNYSSRYSDYDGKVSKYIDSYIERKNKECEENEELIGEYRDNFKKMIEYANSILGDQGFRKSLRSKSTPRARFEALAVGIGLALKERPQLEVVDISGWINEDEFANLTRSDAANNKAKLLARIEYVKDKILLEA